MYSIPRTVFSYCGQVTFYAPRIDSLNLKLFTAWVEAHLFQSFWVPSTWANISGTKQVINTCLFNDKGRDVASTATYWEKLYSTRIMIRTTVIIQGWNLMMLSSPSKLLFIIIVRPSMVASLPECLKDPCRLAFIPSGCSSHTEGLVCDQQEYDISDGTWL